MSVTVAEAPASHPPRGPLPPAELDLSGRAVLTHFAHSTQNPRLLAFLLSLDRVDQWAADFNEVEAINGHEIQQFLQDLQDFVETSLPVLHRVPREFADILAHITTSRCIYLVQYASEHSEGFFDALNVLLSDRDGAPPTVAAVRRRLEAFGRAQLLGDIFSQQRLTRILKVMGSYSDVH